MLRLFYLLVFPLLLNAQVSISVPQTFTSGEAVTFTISASGSDVDFPNIDNIGGYVVQKAGTSSQTSIINGKRSQKLIRKYRFYPTSNVTIPSFKINVNGKVEQTSIKKLTLQKVKKTHSNNFDMTIRINKTNVYVGEEILLTMTFKYKKDVQLYDLQFIKPTFENFWSKQINTNKQPKDNLYVVQKISYLLFPQKDGTITIPPFQINAILPDHQSRNSFFGAATKTKKIYSNSLKINAKSLPNDVYLIGDFKIKATIDKLNIKQGESVSYKLEVSGRGNIDDVEEFNLDVPSATIYDNPSKKDFNIKNGKYGGVYKKSYSIIANEDFIIPAVTLKYFDKRTKKIKTVKTKKYNIKVDTLIKSKQKLEVKKEIISPEKAIETKVITKVVKTSDNEKIMFFIFGILFSAILYTIYVSVINRKKIQEELPLERAIKKCATQNELLKKLIPFVNLDENLDKIIYKLELEELSELKSIKKELLNIVKELKL